MFRRQKLGTAASDLYPGPLAASNSIQASEGQTVSQPFRHAVQIMGSSGPLIRSPPGPGNPPEYSGGTCSCPEQNGPSEDEYYDLQTGEIISRQQCCHGQHSHGQQGLGQHSCGQQGPGQYSSEQQGPGQHFSGQQGPGQHSSGQQGPGQHSCGQQGPGQHSTGQQGPGQTPSVEYPPSQYSSVQLPR
jgi:hypothetical protein